MKTSTIATILAFIAPMSVSASIIDFENLEAGEASFPVTSVSSADDTFTFSLALLNAGDSPGAAIFNSDEPGFDPDLVPTRGPGTGVSGNVLILQEDIPTASGIPDDNAGSGTIVLTLTSGSDFQFTGASAVDDATFGFAYALAGDAISAFGDASFLGEIENPAGAAAGDNFADDLVFASPSAVLGIGDSILINYSGSGAVDSLLLAPVVPEVPVPASALLLGGGIAAFAAVKRRRKSKA